MGNRVSPKWDCGAVVVRLLLHALVAMYHPCFMFEFALGEIFHMAIKGGVMKKMSNLVHQGFNFLVDKGSRTGTCLMSKTKLLAAAAKKALEHGSSDTTPRAI
jgi:hypothetical protein